MTIYTAVCSTKGATVARFQDNNDDLYEYFTGYDTVGYPMWDHDNHDAVIMTLEEADDLAEQFSAADADANHQEPAEPKKYLVQIMLDGETSGHMMTMRELAEHWETDDICGIGYHYSVWDVDSFGMIVSVTNWYDQVQDILQDKRDMQQEYEDYCNELKYADWN